MFLVQWIGKVYVKQVLARFQELPEYRKTASCVHMRQHGDTLKGEKDRSKIKDAPVIFLAWNPPLPRGTLPAEVHAHMDHAK